MKEFFIHFWLHGEDEDSLIVLPSVWKLVLWLIVNRKRLDAVVITSE